MQEPAKRFVFIMLELPSSFKPGDAVKVSFGNSGSIINAQVEAVKFSESTVYYDVSIKMENEKWDNAMFARVNDVHSAFVGPAN